MHLQDAIFATLKIYFWACIYIYIIIGIVLLLSFILKTLRETDESEQWVEGTRDINPFRYHLGKPQK